MIYSGYADKLIGDLATRNFLQEAQTLRAMIGGDGKRAFHREGDVTRYSAAYCSPPLSAARPFVNKCVKLVLEYDKNATRADLARRYPDGFENVSFEELVDSIRSCGAKAANNMTSSTSAPPISPPPPKKSPRGKQKKQALS